MPQRSGTDAIKTLRLREFLRSHGPQGWARTMTQNTADGMYVRIENECEGFWWRRTQRTVSNELVCFRMHTNGLRIEFVRRWMNRCGLIRNKLETCRAQ